MNWFLKRCRRGISVAVLGMGLLLAPAFSPIAGAQDDLNPAPPVPGEGSCRSLDGYLGTLVLVLLAFFIVGKSARR